MTNQDLFEFVVFRILAAIRDGFPRNVRIDFDDLLTDKECPDREERNEICSNCGRWLAANDYVIIDGEEIGGNSFEFVVPTEKLLFIMNSVPPSLHGEKKTLSTFFRECAVSGTNDAIKKAISMLIASSINSIALP